MGGIFGVASKTSCVLDLFFGIDYHSHLGTRRGGMAVYDPEKGFDRAIHNIENSPFRTKFDKDVSELQGNFGIGCISDNEPQPLLVRSHLGNFQFINVRKEWIDDSDAEHRGDVTFTIYQRIGENEFQEIQTVTLKALDFWQKQVEIPTDLDLKNILVLETSVSHTGNNGEAKVPCDLSSNTSSHFPPCPLRRIVRSEESWLYFCGGVAWGEMGRCVIGIGKRKDGYRES